MKPITQTRRFDCRDRKGTHRKKRKSMLFMATLWLGMAVAVFAQDRDDRIRPGLSHTQNPLQLHSQRSQLLHEIEQRYGSLAAVEMSFQLEREDEARREMAKIKAAQRRDRELRTKVVELANTSYKLYERLSDPSVIHADTPELAKRCEKLAKDIKKLLR